MKARVNTQVSINASASEVFKYLSQLDYHFLWNPHLIYISSDENLKLNSKYNTTSHILGVKIKANNQVTKFIKNKLIKIDNTTGMVKYSALYEIIKKSNKTVILKNVTEVEANHKAFAFSTPVLNIMARRELQSDLQSLKLAVENKLQ